MQCTPQICGTLHSVNQSNSILSIIRFTFLSSAISQRKKRTLRKRILWKLSFDYDGSVLAGIIYSSFFIIIIISETDRYYVFKDYFLAGPAIILHKL